jgi:general secretion pathway protein A
MKRTEALSTGLFVIFLGIGLSPVAVFAADSAADAVETGRLLAILLDAGRVTVGANQSLINDPDKGDKGFTPENFEKQVTAKFKDRAKVDLDNLKSEKVPEQAKKLLPQLVDAMKQDVADYQPVINRAGVGFKGFIPAKFGTDSAAKFRAKTGVYFKQTHNPSRNPKNAPDEFELKALAKFAESSYPRQGDKILSETVDGGKAVRVMLPLYYGKGCLSCHGDPKGEKDISGYMKEGAKEGDNGGAVSVKLTLK